MIIKIEDLIFNPNYVVRLDHFITVQGEAFTTVIQEGGSEHLIRLPREEVHRRIEEAAESRVTVRAAALDVLLWAAKNPDIPPSDRIAAARELLAWWSR